MAVKKITKRWIFNSLGAILFILIILEISFAIGIRWFYYSSISQSLSSQANAISALLVKYSKDSSTDFLSQARSLVENFEEKDKMELMAIDVDGNIILTSSGFQIENSIVMPDFQEAMSAHSGVGQFQGSFGNEKIIAVSVASKVSGTNIAAMRLVVSLTKVNRQITILILVVTMIGIAILFFVILSSSYFINSIVNPISDVGDIARKIAQGNFDTKLVKKNDDEIGELCDIINYMADELSNAEKIKNDFISSVSHELRTPLTAIKGWGETLISDENVDKLTLQKGMHVIMSETDRLTSMVEELLDFSRMQSGRLRLIIDKFDVLAELGDAVLMYTERAKREGIELTYDEPDILIPVYGDKNRIRQVFINIIDNALKYSDEGDSVAVRSVFENNYFVITVKDTGCGISPEDLPQIKHKFFKANLTRRGSGIGLAVADEIVARHGGTLTLESKLNEGTTVTITLPANKKPEDLVNNDDII
ncbi:MAG: HAMP domain-containing sensor histidine kinase [Oscillospiraceae bacterium]